MLFFWEGGGINGGGLPHLEILMILLKTFDENLAGSDLEPDFGIVFRYDYIGFFKF